MRVACGDFDGGCRGARRGRFRCLIRSRPSGLGRARSRSRQRRIRRSSSRRQRWATRSRRSRPACSKVADLVVVSKVTSLARSGPPRSSGRCWSHPRRAVTVTRGHGRSGPRSLSRRLRPGSACPNCSPRWTDTVTRRAGGGVVRRPTGARRGASLGDRRRPSAARLDDDARAAATDALFAEVAEHRLDPYSAADRLLEGSARD